MSIWDLKAGGYDTWRHIPGIRWILEKEIRNLRFLFKLIPEIPDTIVDIGTGAGSTLGIFPDSIKVIGLDSSFEMIRQAIKQRKVKGLVGDARRLPFKKQSIRFFSLVGVTEYIADHHNLLKEIENVLSPGGYFLTTVSPVGFFGWLRIGLGHTLRLVRREKWEKSIKQFPFECLGQRQSILQIQYLYKKRSEACAE